ncbi:hypothetical protein FB451DRAFT_1342430 [Mycena latifolia]|nr:hypothetical protein FB451DRAFT_1342430 [Mycena latifolia]
MVQRNPWTGFRHHKFAINPIIRENITVFMDNVCPGTSQFRLLSRGALSLPDSHLLDGLTFAACLDHPSSGHKLLQNPLALALCADGPACVRKGIHPNATLTRIYFENMFCPDPASSLDLGIKVALGDSGTELQLVVARTTPAPPPPSLCLPRPDDPTPHRPPIRFNRSANTGANPFVKKRIGSLAELVSGVRVGVDAGSFKIPDMPRSNKGKKRALDVDAEDVGSASARRTRRTENQMEKANKTSTIHLLPIPKTHPEYKDVYGAVYRGVVFALRAEMRSAVDLKVVECFVKIHVNMYAHAKGHNKT